MDGVFLSLLSKANTAIIPDAILEMPKEKSNYNFNKYSFCFIVYPWWDQDTVSLQWGYLKNYATLKKIVTVVLLCFTMNNFYQL